MWLWVIGATFLVVIAYGLSVLPWLATEHPWRVALIAALIIAGRVLWPSTRRNDSP